MAPLLDTTYSNIFKLARAWNKFPSIVTFEGSGNQHGIQFWGGRWGSRVWSRTHVAQTRPWNFYVKAWCVIHLASNPVGWNSQWLMMVHNGPTPANHSQSNTVKPCFRTVARNLSTTEPKRQLRKSLGRKARNHIGILLTSKNWYPLTPHFCSIHFPTPGPPNPSLRSRLDGFFLSS